MRRTNHENHKVRRDRPNSYPYPNESKPFLPTTSSIFPKSQINQNWNQNKLHSLLRDRIPDKISHSRDVRFGAFLNGPKMCLNRITAA
ncbi:MAG: hypothetical protein DWI24_05850 [Planctomycetota bacterium]|nr:MAG: hypothetical protein DWI24_05850 [Planctomycetota bacterium]